MLHLKKKRILPGAISYGSLEDVKTLIESGIDLNPKETLTPLFFAIERGDKGIVEILLKNGAEPNTNFFKKVSPLSWAIMRLKGEEQLGVVKTLIKYRADVNRVDQSGALPIHIAAGNGKIKLIKILIKNGADVNAKTNCEMLHTQVTPLHLAAEGGYKKAVELLINYGADITATGLDKQALLDRAESKKDMFYDLGL